MDKERCECFHRLSQIWIVSPRIWERYKILKIESPKVSRLCPRLFAFFFSMRNDFFSDKFVVLLERAPLEFCWWRFFRATRVRAWGHFNFFQLLTDVGQTTFFPPHPGITSFFYHIHHLEMQGTGGQTDVRRTDDGTQEQSLVDRKGGSK